jgi:hypothetical protein
MHHLAIGRTELGLIITRLLANAAQKQDWTLLQQWSDPKITRV